MRRCDVVQVCACAGRCVLMCMPTQRRGGCACGTWARGGGGCRLQKWFGVLVAQ